MQDWTLELTDVEFEDAAIGLVSEIQQQLGLNREQARRAVAYALTRRVTIGDILATINMRRGSIKED